MNSEPKGHQVDTRTKTDQLDSNCDAGPQAGDIASGAFDRLNAGARALRFQVIAKIIGTAAALMGLVLGAYYLGPGMMDRLAALFHGLSSLSPVQLTAIAAIVLALGFDFVNGFHDTAHAVATIIYSKVLSPRMAIGMSALLNCMGALLIGTSVALFMTSVIPLQSCTIPVIVAVLMAGLVWNLLTWYRGLPVSSSHCLIGSLVGAGAAAAGWSGINFHALNKAAIALIVSPVAGFIIALSIAWLLKQLIRKIEGNYSSVGTYGKGAVSKILPWCQILSSASVSFSHGGNDGQKTMGIITLILSTQFAAYGYDVGHVPSWVVYSAALAIGLGTAVGGWRIITTVGEKLSHKAIDPLHGCSAEFTTAATVFAASHLGVPVSTTHTLTSAVVGATAGLHGPEHINTKTFKSIGLAWIFTFPATAGLAAMFYILLASLL